MVHGAFSCPVQQRTLLVAFSNAGFPSYALALRGHSPGDAARIHGASVMDYVHDVRAMLPLVGERPIVVGHSMGGLITAKVVSMGGCRAGVLIAAAPTAPVRMTLPSAPTFLKLLPRVLMGATLDPPREALRRITLGNVAPEKHDNILNTFVPDSGVAFRDMVLGKIRVRRDDISCPLLAVFGDADLLVPPAQMRATARKLGATIHEHPGSGHAIFEEPNGPKIVGRIIAWCQGIL
jgi:alpha-beta hydrolase superfamily lysophospholipase